MVQRVYMPKNVEPLSPRKGHTKVRLSFQDSLQRLQNEGYRRHVRPAEAFDLIIEGLEGRIPESEERFGFIGDGSQGETTRLWRAAYKDMVEARFTLEDPYIDDPNGNIYFGNGRRVRKIPGSPQPEFVSMALERKGNQLTVYIDPQRLKPKSFTDEADGKKGWFFTYNEKHAFELEASAGIPYNNGELFLSAERLPDRLAQLVFGRLSPELPKEMKEKGLWHAGLIIPADGRIAPATLGTKRLGIPGFLDDLMAPCIVGCSNYAASRGVRE